MALDTTSPLLSVATGSAERALCERSVAATRSSAVVMELVDDCLRAAGLSPRELTGMVVLSGPGSFTGLRVGLALAQGFHQALNLPVGTITTFEVLASTPSDATRPLIAAVPAGRCTWQLQRFDAHSPRQAQGEPVHSTDETLLNLSRGQQVIGFGLDRLVAQEAAATQLLTPPPLAAVALSVAPRSEWNAERLTEPLYLTPPPVDPQATARH